MRKVARSVGSIVRSPLGQAIGSRLKGVIKTALPLAGTALGTMAGGPLGASIGSGLASTAGRAFGLELEGLSHEDQELDSGQALRALRQRSGDGTRYRHLRRMIRRRPRGPPSLRLRDGARRDCCASLLRRTRAPARIGFILQCATRSSPPAAASLHIRHAEDSMHDIDRIQLETDSEWRWRTTNPGSPAGCGETGDVFGEAEEMELASQLMEVSNEQELDQFLGDLIRRAGRALGGFVSSPDGQAIGGILKGAARQILPHAAGAVGASLADRSGRTSAAAWRRWAGSQTETGIRKLEPGRPRVRRRQAVRARRRRHGAERDGRGGPDGSDGRPRKPQSRRRPRCRRPGCCSRPRSGTRMGSYPARIPAASAAAGMRRGNRIVLFGV